MSLNSATNSECIDFFEFDESFFKWPNLDDKLNEFFNNKYSNLNEYSIVKYPNNIEIKDSKDNFCKKALDKIVQSDVGFKIIKEVLQNQNINLIKIRYDKTSYTGVNCKTDNIYEIVLGNRKKQYYFTKLPKEDIPESFWKYFNSNELKKIAIIDSPDAQLIHEFCHIRHASSDFRRYQNNNNTPSLKKDIRTKEEEEAILNGENLYHKALNEPMRIDHLATVFPAYVDILHKSQKKQTQAFWEYLVYGSHLDTIKISEQFTNAELENILNQRASYGLPEILINVSWENFHSIGSQHFLDLLLALIEERKLNINFSNLKWRILYNMCLLNMQTLDQFNKLQELKADKNDRVIITDSYLFTIDGKIETQMFLNLASKDSLFDVLKIKDINNQTILDWAIQNNHQNSVLNILKKLSDDEIVAFLNNSNKTNQNLTHNAKNDKKRKRK